MKNPTESNLQSEFDRICAEARARKATGTLPSQPVFSKPIPRKDSPKGKAFFKVAPKVIDLDANPAHFTCAQCGEAKTFHQMGKISGGQLHKLCQRCLQKGKSADRTKIDARQAMRREQKRAKHRARTRTG